MDSPDKVNIPQSGIVEIPGKFTFSRTHNTPSTSILLPLHVRTRATPMLILSAFYTVCTLISLIVVYGGFVIIYNDPDKISGYYSLFLTPIWACFAATCAGTALTCFLDAMRNLPVLHIDLDGLTDERTNVFIPWDSISQVQILVARQHMSCLQLDLISKVTASQNRFRLGARLNWKLKPNEIRVPILYLDIDSYIIAHAVVSRVRQHGGVGEASRWN